MRLNHKAPVSVVIPCYRCSQTIQRAIDSVVQQTQQPKEVILVDDASGDNTLDMLENIACLYPGWIKLVKLPTNIGAAGARNAGWKVAENPLIAFLDADDAWHPGKIEIQYGYMESHPEILLCGHAHRLLKSDDSRADWEVKQWEDIRINKGEMLISNRFITPSVMLRANLQHRFRSEQRYMEDHLLWLEIICAGGEVTKLSAELAAIHKNPFGTSGLSSQLWLMEKGDLSNYKKLYSSGCINFGQWTILSVYSLIKYLRRLLICWGDWQWKR